MAKGHENIIPPQKGEVRNPKGRGKGTLNRSTVAKRIMGMKSIIPEQVFEEMKAYYPDLKQKMSIEEMIMMIQANKAITRQDTQAAAFMMDNLYGKQSSVDLTTKGESLNDGFLRLMKTASIVEDEDK